MSKYLPFLIAGSVVVVGVVLWSKKAKADQGQLEFNTAGNQAGPVKKLPPPRQNISRARRRAMAAGKR